MTLTKLTFSIFGCSDHISDALHWLWVTEQVTGKITLLTYTGFSMALCHGRIRSTHTPIGHISSCCIVFQLPSSMGCRTFPCSCRH